jgi:hypothetical protein
VLPRLPFFVSFDWAWRGGYLCCTRINMAKKPASKKGSTRKAPAKAVEPASNVVTFPSPLKTCVYASTGRPTYRSEENMKIILELISEGWSLLAIGRLEGFPSRNTLREWLAEDPEFQAQYARAYELSADVLVEEALEIADDNSDDWVDKYNGKGEVIGRRVDPEAVARSKLRIDTRFWVAGRRKPKKYGKQETPPPEPVRTRLFDIPEDASDADAGSLYRDAIRGE